MTIDVIHQVSEAKCQEQHYDYSISGQKTTIACGEFGNDCLGLRWPLSRECPGDIYSGHDVDPINLSCRSTPNHPAGQVWWWYDSADKRKYECPTCSGSGRIPDVTLGKVLDYFGAEVIMFLPQTDSQGVVSWVCDVGEVAEGGETKELAACAALLAT